MSFEWKCRNWLNVTSARNYIPSFRENKPKTFSMTEYERFGLVFTNTRVYKFKHWLNIGKIFGMKKKSSHTIDDDIGSMFYLLFTLRTKATFSLKADKYCFARTNIPIFLPSKSLVLIITNKNKKNLFSF